MIKKYFHIIKLDAMVVSTFILPLKKNGVDVIVLGCTHYVFIKEIIEEKKITEGEELNFRSVDGMYSYCTRDNGEVVHLAAWTDVEIIEDYAK